MEAPLMKPLITGWLRKLARKPIRSRPSTNSSTPDSSASQMASCRYSAEPMVAKGPSRATVISAVTATGPTDMLMLVPNRA
jgi:hypothetical protein